MHPRTASPEGAIPTLHHCKPYSISQQAESRLPCLLSACQLLSVPSGAARLSPRKVPEMPSQGIQAQATDGESLGIASSDLAKILCLKKASTAFIYSSDISVATRVWSSPSQKALPSASNLSKEQISFPLSNANWCHHSLQAAQAPRAFLPMCLVKYETSV